MTILAVDCMGGDHGPSVTLPACRRFLDDHPDAQLLLVGLPQALQSFQHPRARIIGASEVVAMDDPVETALRRKKDSSMRVAIVLVKDGQAQAAVSAGNTGALMALARYLLKTEDGIDRPAIAYPMPNAKGGATTVLDLGANVDCTEQHLLQFAVMGSALVSALRNVEAPTVGLLNIGEETIKGSEVIKRAGELLRSAANAGDLNFHGNVEGNDIFKGTTDIVVCDGFVGNIVLKSIEATATAVLHWLKSELLRSPIRMAGAWLARGAFRTIKKKASPDEYGGMPLLGVNGLCIIAHGGSSPTAIKNAIRQGAESIRNQVNPQIIEEVRRYNTQRTPVGASPTHITS
jgi:glycerol-3-phosphate acyltransferase PlsX